GENMQNFYDNFKENYVIIRSYDSGVHFGIMKEYDFSNRHVLLKEARRLWKWRAFTLSEVSLHGMKDNQAKISQEIENIIIANVIEIIPCTEEAIKNIKNYSAYQV